MSRKTLHGAKVNKKKHHILEVICNEFGIPPARLYEAIGWSRQRFYYACKYGKGDSLFTPEMVRGVAEVANITPLQLKSFLAEYYFG